MTTLDVVFFCLLLIGSGVFSGAESALTAVNRVRVRSLAQGGSKTAARLDILLEDRSRLISALLIGNNLVNVALTVLVAKVVESLVSGGAEGTSDWVAVAVVTPMLVVFGEVIPKTVGVNLSLPFSMVMAWPIFIVRQLLTPLTILLSGLQRLVLKIFGHNPESDMAVTGEEIQTMVEMASAQEVLGRSSSLAISNLISLHELIVREVLTPRIDVVGIPADADFRTTQDVFLNHPYSRLPVYKDDIDTIVGILHVRDLLTTNDEERASFRAELRARPPMFVPEQKRVEVLIHDLRQERQHMAIVVDEFGGTAGIVTLENLLEEVVGQIEDEFDAETQPVRRLGNSIALLDGSCAIADLEEFLGHELGDVEDVDTVAGLFLREFDRIPEEGNSVSVSGLTLVVRKMRGQRILRLLVRQEQQRPRARHSIEKLKVSAREPRSSASKRT